MKTALVTGASRGIGAEIARTLAKSGVFVYINYVNSKDLAEKVAAKIGGRAVCADISDEKAVSDMFDIIEKEHGGVDILVNNAGVSSWGMLADTSPEEWDRVFGINMRGAYLVTKHASEWMVKNKYGRIVNISSMWGEVGAACEVAYSASKAALIGFTKALAKELSLSGITVNCISPGLIDTDMNKNLTNEDIEALKGDIPLGRVGNPSEIASVAGFLCSDAAGYMTGQVISVSGGMII